MEKFYLEEPSISRKEEALDYLNEHVEYKSDINGSGGMDDCLEGLSYEDWLVKVSKKKDKDYAYSINRVPGETYFLIRENDNKIIGMINIRHDLTPAMLEFGGHIGYGIRPTERRKGYNKINLYLGLFVARKFNLDKVMLDCTVDNIGSNKTIQSLGGVLIKSDIDPYDNTLTNVYEIDVDKAINDYSDIYEDMISSKNNFNNKNKVL